MIEKAKKVCTTMNTDAYIDLVEEIAREGNLTPFQKALKVILRDHGYANIEYAELKAIADDLISIHEKEREEELQRAYETADSVQYEKGKEAAKAEMPTWDKIDTYEGPEDDWVLTQLTTYDSNGARTEKALRHGSYIITLAELDKLPKKQSIWD